MKKKTDGNTLERFLTPYQNSRLSLALQEVWKKLVKKTASLTTKFENEKS